MYQMNEQVACMEQHDQAAQSQGAAKNKMAQVRIVVGRDSTNVLTWERGMDILSIYEMSSVERITLHMALGVERIIRGIVK